MTTRGRCYITEYRFQPRTIYLSFVSEIYFHTKETVCPPANICFFTEVKVTPGEFSLFLMFMKRRNVLMSSLPVYTKIYMKDEEEI